VIASYMATVKVGNMVMLRADKMGWIPQDDVCYGFLQMYGRVNGILKS
jgi:hypothetical protein